MDATFQLEINSNLSAEESELLTDIGYVLENGTVFKQDYAAAVTIYNAAAEEGNARAMNNLAWLIHNGRGIKKDIKKAIEIYECAAANGNTTAMGESW